MINNLTADQWVNDTAGIMISAISEDPKYVEQAFTVLPYKDPNLYGPHAVAVISKQVKEIIFNLDVKDLRVNDTFSDIDESQRDVRARLRSVLRNNNYTLTIHIKHRDIGDKWVDISPFIIGTISFKHSNLKIQIKQPGEDKYDN